MWGQEGGGPVAELNLTMSAEVAQEGVSVSSPPGTARKECYFDRVAEGDPEYLRLRNMAPTLRQDFNVMEQKKRVTVILQSPAFREELESLIQEQLRKGNDSSNVRALRHIVDFISSSGSCGPLALPTSPPGPAMVAPINDVHGTECPGFVKGERLMRCKIASVYRLLDIFGWAQLAKTYITLRVSKEQGHFLIIPRGISYGEASASVLVKVNIVGGVVNQGSSGLPVDCAGFGLHSAIYAARPDVCCVIHLQTPATAAVSAMKCGILPISHEALLIGDVAYYEYNGALDEEKDRIQLQKCLGPTAKVLLLRNHGVVALGETVEEAFYKIYHLQSACEIQVSCLSCAGGVENVTLLDRERYRPLEAGALARAVTTFGPVQKSRLGEHEFEALMRMLDNLGYRTGYAYRHPVVQERAKHKSEVEIPATVTAFAFDEDVLCPSALRHHSQRQQLEKTRWLNSPNIYLRVSDDLHGDAGRERARTTWLKADEVSKSSSGTPIKIKTPNQFVPLFTDPREVLETRNKIREQNRQDMKSAGPQSQLLAGVIMEKSPSTSTDGALEAAGARSPEEEVELAGEEPEPPNPFNELTDQELEDYKREVQWKQLGLDGPDDEDTSAGISPLRSPVPSPTKSPTSPRSPGETTLPSDSKGAGESETPGDGKPDGGSVEEQLSKGISTMMANANAENGVEEVPRTGKDHPETGTGAPLSPDGSPSKSPSKKKKKFRTPSFLKKSKKKEKTET
ncbi:beta-adducin-like isoform X2 [Rhincodon typus]|uniref:beta-adducin-like isoform X2 n=1 Tax=Rhincodon typus TaxID=259920 RepID=UPI002030A795|nr:beta-adducin-like isoform X2 [Rhincodon typus]